MNTTYRESFVRSATADLSRQIDDILDRRFEHSHQEDLEEVKPKDPNPIAKVRTLFKGFVHK